jgi:hypothetical protein
LETCAVAVRRSSAFKASIPQAASVQTAAGLSAFGQLNADCSGEQQVSVPAIMGLISQLLTLENSKYEPLNGGLTSNR